LIEEWTINYTHYEVMKILQKAGVAAMPSFNAEELFHDPQLNERHCWVEIDHPVIGKQVVVAPPWKLSATPAKITRPAPLFGEHSHYVFRELLGLSSEEIAQLEEEKVIY
jgi:benzylsuccinate CoA-transferase BbsF subunit